MKYDIVHCTKLVKFVFMVIQNPFRLRRVDFYTFHFLQSSLCILVISCILLSFLPFIKIESNIFLAIIECKTNYLVLFV